MTGEPAPPLVELDDQALAFLHATAQRVDALQQRERRRRTRTITVLSTLLVLALIAAGVAVRQQQRASGAQRTLIARGMVAQADRIRDQDPRLALQLGVAAEQFDAGLQTHTSLRQTLESTPHFRTLSGHSDEVCQVAFAPDGRTLATTGTDQPAPDPAALFPSAFSFWPMPTLRGTLLQFHKPVDSSRFSPLLSTSLGNLDSQLESVDGSLDR